MDRVYRVVASPDRIPDDRNFGAKIAEQKGELVLLVPLILLPLLVERVVEKSDLFLALALTDPRAIAEALGWSVEQVAKARKGLLEIIRAPITRPSFAPPPIYPPRLSKPERHSFSLPPRTPPKKKLG